METGVMRGAGPELCSAAVGVLRVQGFALSHVVPPGAETGL